MKSSPLENLRGRLEEHLASVWKLLSDTNHFLSRTPLFGQYEDRIRVWRHELEVKKNDSARVSEIRKDIVALRKELRERGYNLRLGNYDLEVKGFRSDDAMGLGFARAVLCDLPSGVYISTGQGNHIELSSQLQMELQRLRVGSTGSSHSLWYRWDNRLLRISGADSETREDFERFMKAAEAEPMRYIAAFRHI